MNSKLKVLYINTSDIRGGAAKVPWSISETIKNKVVTKFLVGVKSSNSKNVRETGSNIWNHLIGFITANDIDFGIKNDLFNNSWYKMSNIIHCNNLHGDYFNLNNFIRMSKEKKIVWTLHDEWALMAGGVWSTNILNNDGFYKRESIKTYPKALFDNSWYLSKRKKQIYKKSKFTIVVPSLWLYKKVKKSVLKDKKIQVIYNGVDNNVFKKLDKKICRKELGLPVDKKLVLFLANGGKNNNQKGWYYTEKVIEHYHDSKKIMFVCVGGNDSLTKDNLINIPYQKDETILAKYYSACDIFLFTSIYENFPLVTLEAMSCGLPIVSFDVGGTKEGVINGKCGHIIKGRKIENIYRAIDKIFNLKEDVFEKMSIYCSSHIKNNFSLEKMANEYYSLYKELINNEN